MLLNRYFRILLLIFFVSTAQIQAQDGSCTLDSLVTNVEISQLTQVNSADGVFLIFDAILDSSSLAETYSFDIGTNVRYRLTVLDEFTLHPQERTFSPDGNYMVFLASGFGDLRPQLYSVALPDGAPHRLSIDLPEEALNPDRPQLRSTPEPIIRYFITPDSRYVLYTITYELTGVQHIYRVPIAGGESIDMTPSFSAPAYGAVLLPTTTVFTSDNNHFIFLYFDQIGRPSIFSLDLSTWDVREFIATSFNYPGAPLVDSLLQHPDYDLIYTNSTGGLTYQQMFAYDFDQDEHYELTLPLPSNIQYINNVIFDESQSPTTIAYYIVTTNDNDRQLYAPTGNGQLEYIRSLPSTTDLIPQGIILNAMSADRIHADFSFIPYADPLQTIDLAFGNWHLDYGAGWSFVNDYMLSGVYDSEDPEQRRELVRIDLSVTGNGAIQSITPMLSTTSPGVSGKLLLDADNTLYFVFDQQLYRSAYPYDSYELLTTIHVDRLHSILPDGRLLLLSNNMDGTQNLVLIQCEVR
jgi:hypothetical protein